MVEQTYDQWLAATRAAARKKDAQMNAAQAQTPGGQPVHLNVITDTSPIQERPPSAGNAIDVVDLAYMGLHGTKREMDLVGSQFGQPAGGNTLLRQAYEGVNLKKSDPIGYEIQYGAGATPVLLAAQQVQRDYIKGYNQGTSAVIMPSDVSPLGYVVTYQKNRPGEQSTITYYDNRIMSTVEPLKTQAERPMYVSDITVSSPEQVADVRTWAAEHDATVRRTGVGPAATYKIDYSAWFPNSPVISIPSPRREIHLEILTPVPLESGTFVPVRSQDTIREQRIEMNTVGMDSYDTATTEQKNLLHVATLLSPAGIEYVGAAALSLAPVAPLLTTPIVGPMMATNVMLNAPGTKTVVKSEQARIVKEKAAGTFNTGAYALQSATSNPVVIVESAFLAGAGLSALAAALPKAGSMAAYSATGMRILTSPAGPALMQAANIAKAAAGPALIVTGMATAGIQSYEAGTYLKEGKTAKAVGTWFMLGSEIGAGVAGFNAQMRRVMAAPTKTVIETNNVIHLESATTPGEVVTSRGNFEVVEGPLKGLRGNVQSISDKGGNLILRTEVPQQKVGKLKVSEKVTYDYGEQGTIGRLTKAKTGDMLLIYDDKILPVGPKSSISRLLKLADTGEMRIFSGSGRTETASKYKMDIIAHKNTVGIIERATIGQIDNVKITVTDRVVRAGEYDFKPDVFNPTPGKREFIWEKTKREEAADAAMEALKHIGEIGKTIKTPGGSGSVKVSGRSGTLEAVTRRKPPAEELSMQVPAPAFSARSLEVDTRAISPGRLMSAGGGVLINRMENISIPDVSSALKIETRKTMITTAGSRSETQRAQKPGNFVRVTAEIPKQKTRTTTRTTGKVTIQETTTTSGGRTWEKLITETPSRGVPVPLPSVPIINPKPPGFPRLPLIPRLNWSTSIGRTGHGRKTLKNPVPEIEALL